MRADIQINIFLLPEPKEDELAKAKREFREKFVDPLNRHYDGRLPSTLPKKKDVGELHGVRYWPAVPRLGESILLNVGKKDEPAEYRLAEVIKVNWGMSDRNVMSTSDTLEVNLLVRLI